MFKDMNHAEVVAAAMRWLKECKRCEASYSEIKGIGRERPDAIGFKLSGWCVAIECKTSLTDAANNARKPHHWFNGLGNERWLAMPKSFGAIDKLQLRNGMSIASVYKGWGILAVDRDIPWNFNILCRPPESDDNTTHAGFLMRQLVGAERKLRSLKSSR